MIATGPRIIITVIPVAKDTRDSADRVAWDRAELKLAFRRQIASFVRQVEHRNVRRRVIPHRPISRIERSCFQTEVKLAYNSGVIIYRLYAVRRETTLNHSADRTFLE